MNYRSTSTAEEINVGCAAASFDKFSARRTRDINVLSESLVFFLRPDAYFIER